ALAAGAVLTFGGATPAPAPDDGDMHVVGQNATGAWAEQDDDLAIFMNGDWLFVAPWAGCRVWIEGNAEAVVYDGEQWVPNWMGGSPSGAATQSRVVEIDHELAAGAASVTVDVIPDKAVVLGVTGRVIQAIGGVNGWSIGVPGSVGRYGSGYNPSLNAFARGVTGQPLAYYGATALELTADNGAFTGGVVRLAVHFTEIQPPQPV
ncbi:MAG: DUF2793 domain-containing protein, partial [Pseudomonadota bacterium]